ncbi:MAG: 4Fe-4S cluster-binding domain-containing protein [Atopobiaceae bacterium]|nr:4Fe-4S cluster-binding domain-containing protein [Atopobiaceae bacterium]
MHAPQLNGRPAARTRTRIYKAGTVLVGETAWHEVLNHQTGESPAYQTNIRAIREFIALVLAGTSQITFLVIQTEAKHRVRLGGEPFMITIVEPKEHIAKLWGEQKIKEGATYRMMRYVLRVDHKGKTLLHNVVTGQLVLLDDDEITAVEVLPAKYSEALKRLIAKHYLVPEDYDEHQQVLNLRRILQKLSCSDERLPVTSYTILTTTACNARCYYCYQHGIATEYMSEETAQKAAEFIHANCNNKRVHITWFGGEPTLGTKAINTICSVLQSKGVEYTSHMISNGYLFDDKLVKLAKELWHLADIQISFDGTEKTYNAVKAFRGAATNPYKRVMRNIGLFLENEIAVNARMNFDVDTVSEYRLLLDDLLNRFGKNHLLNVSAHQVIGEYAYADGHISHGDSGWFKEAIVNVNDISREAGFVSGRLPNLRYKACIASSKTALTVTPSGNLVSCPEQIGCDQVKGSLDTGVTNDSIVDAWSREADYDQCISCALYPDCLRLINCTAKDNCNYSLEYLKRYSFIASKRYDSRLQIGL